MQIFACFIGDSKTKYYCSKNVFKSVWPCRRPGRICHRSPIYYKKTRKPSALADAEVSMASAAAAIASLDDTDFIKDCKQKNEQTKDICYAAFKELQLDYIPSSANFILFNIDKLKVDLAKEMQGKNIYVQHREHFGERWCRVTMGTEEEMQQFVKALKEIAG